MVDNHVVRDVTEVEGCHVPMRVDGVAVHAEPAISRWCLGSLPHAASVVIGWGEARFEASGIGRSGGDGDAESQFGCHCDIFQSSG